MTTDDAAIEAARLAALARYQILDTPPEPIFDALTRLAAHIGGTPIALISLVDATRQWFKSRMGVDAEELPLDAGLCPFTVREITAREREPLVIPDTLADPRFAKHPSVTATPQVRFYAGFPLVTLEGHAIGTLCMVDHQPRRLSEDQIKALRALAAEVMIQLELRRENLALKLAQERLGLILEAAGEGIYGLDAQGRFQFVNVAAARLLGWQASELLGRSMHDVIQHSLADGTPRLESQSRVLAALKNGDTSGVAEGEIFWRKDGTFFPVSYTSAPVYEAGQLVGAAVVFRDVTERKRTEERLSYLANYDTLTNLPNRVLFMDRLQQALTQAPRHERLVAVLFLDVDRFKNINDSLGHSVGDLLLKEVAQRLCGCVRESDTVARLGGDEFVVMLTEIARPDAPALLAQKLVDALRQPFEVAGHTVAIGASVGLALHPRDGANAGTLLENADTAMYRAKEGGRNQYRQYS